jgi:3-methyl-2-oxobutanoate hydroxymethyltransferase
MKKKLTIRELLDSKGQRKITMTNAPDASMAKACELAGIDIVGGRGGRTIEQMCAVLDELQRAIPNTLLAFNLPTADAWVSETDAVRCALLAVKHGADIVYSSGNHISRFQAMVELGIPCVGHVGLVPAKATWLGGYRAVGKTCEEAVKVYNDALAFQEAGAIAVEMECVPEKIAAEITRRLKILTISLGSGRHCDGQFLYSCDILGTHNDHYPRHVKKYADFFGESVKAFQQFKQEVDDGRFPQDSNTIQISDSEYEDFLKRP